MIKIKDGHVYSSDGKIVRRKSNGACGRNHSALPADKVADFEELDELPHYTESEYNTKVSELIHERYSADRETSLINNMLDEEPTQEHIAEYREYQRFRAECKARARQELETAWQQANAPQTVPDETDMAEPADTDNAAD